MTFRRTPPPLEPVHFLPSIKFGAQGGESSDDRAAAPWVTLIPPIHRFMRDDVNATGPRAECVG